jgi:ABC-type multidrug transport system ATPase subunit
MAEVEEVCDRIIFLNHGEIVANDKPLNLAKSLTTCHVRLLVNEHLEEAKQLLIKIGYKLEFDENWLNVTLEENQISDLLHTLSQNKVHFIEISIDKPSLHDYFLKIARKANLDT